MQTKSCNLTEDEIQCLMAYHGRNLDVHSAIVNTDKSDIVERINYLNKRLKTFSEPDKAEPAAPPVPVAPEAPKAWGQS